MKNFKIALPVIIIVGVCLSWIALSDVESASPWPQKNGELCWELFPPSGTPTTVKLAVVRTFKDHYIAHGTITELIPEGSEDVEYVRCLNGNAEIVGDRVIMHGSTSGVYGDELVGGLGYVELDSSSLDGASVGIQMWYDTSFGPGDTGKVKYDGPVDWELTQCN